MIQKCSNIQVLKVFFEEPRNIHFIREISKKINLAPTSVRNYINDFVEEGLIQVKKSKPFNGYVANRDSEKFIFYKRVYNLYTLEELKEFIIKNYSPQLAVVFGSYSFGEDVEESDIDILILTKGKKDIFLQKFEKILKREINLIVLDNLTKLDKPLIKKVYNGFVICGGFDG